MLHVSIRDSAITALYPWWEHDQSTFTVQEHSAKNQEVARLIESSLKIHGIFNCATLQLGLLKPQTFHWENRFF